MSGKNFRFHLLVLWAIMAAACRPGGDAEEAGPGVANQSLLAEVSRLVRDEYVDPVDPQVKFPAAFLAMMKALDPHCAYLDPDATQSFRALMDGKQFESGIWGKMENDRFRVQVVRPGSPADLAGIRVDDVILAAADRPLYALPDWTAWTALFGATPADLALRVRRSGQTLRERIHLRLAPPSGGLVQKLENGVFWIHFGRLRRERLAELAALPGPTEAAPLVIDLRFGEWVDPATFQRFCRLILPPGARLQLKRRRETISWDIAGTEKRRGPLVAVIDPSTRQLPELLAVLCRRAGIPLIGRSSGGAVPYCEWFRLGDGSSLILRAGQFQIGEEILPDASLKPDEEVPETRMNEITTAAARFLQRTR